MAKIIELPHLEDINLFIIIIITIHLFSSN